MLKKELKWKVLSWFAIAILLYGMTLMQVPMAIKNIFLVVSTSLCLCICWKDNSEEKWEIAILGLGVLARVAFCYLDVYTDFHLPIGGGDDGITFMKTAVEYYHGNFERQYTNYPYILYVIFQVTGINQYAAQYANILCWGIGAILLQKSCRKLEIRGWYRNSALGVMAWLPANIWISSVLYRDTFVMLFLFLSFYWLLCWMNDEKNFWLVGSVLSVLFATWLHGGSIIALCPIVMTVMFYRKQEKRFCITKKNVIQTLGLCGAMIGLLLIPQVRQVVLAKIPSMEGGLINGLNRWLAAKYDYSEGAGSNYMEGRYVTGYFDLLVFTIQKIYYHMFSPVPHMWRGVTDAAAFFGSSAIIYLLTSIIWIASYFYKKVDAYRFVLFVENFVTIGIYAWGNVNGGTAVRHREKILGMMLLLTMYSLKIILQGRKERKNGEKDRSNEL